MSQRFRIDDVEYATDSLDSEGREIVARLTFTQLTLHELNNQMALLTKAKNAYIADLKMEIVRETTGVDLGALFSDD